MRAAAAISLVCLILAGCGSASKPAVTNHAQPKARTATAASGPVVLGSSSFIVWGGIGFGTPHPAKLVVGSDPSVIITRIHWVGWGRWNASGVGLYAVPIFGKGGSYYRKPFRAQLQVSGIGSCPNGPRRTYMKLKVRVALQPGQRPAWYEADGSHGLCSYP